MSTLDKHTLDLDSINKEAAEQPYRIPTELIDKILNMYGPEGCYEMADKLIGAANKDINDATKTTF